MDANQRVEHPTTSFQHLPFEMKTEIFSYLSSQELCRAASVCQNWREVITYNVHLWKTLRHDYEVTLPKEKRRSLVRFITRYCTFFLALTFFSKRIKRRKSIDRFLNGFTFVSLKKLTLDGCRISVTLFIEFSKYFPNLVSLKLKNAYCDDSGPNDDFEIDMENEFSQMTRVTRVYLDVRGFWDDNYIIVSMGRFPNLQKFTLTDEHTILPPTIKQFLRLCKGSLTHFKWTDSIPKAPFKIFPDCSKLTHLDLDQCFNVSDQHLKGIEPLSLITLKLNFYIEFCSITENGLIQFFQHRARQSLQTLLLKRFNCLSDACLEEMARTCKNLTRVTFQGCSGITLVGVIAHVWLLLRLTHSLRLTHLSILECKKVSPDIGAVIASTENFSFRYKAPNPWVIY